MRHAWRMRHSLATPALKQSIYCNAPDTCICFWQRSEITLYTRSQIDRLLYNDITKRFETARA